MLKGLVRQWYHLRRSGAHERHHDHGKRRRNITMVTAVPNVLLLAYLRGELGEGLGGLWLRLRLRLL